MKSDNPMKKHAQLIGREAEMKQIVRLIQGAETPMLFLEGAPGIGKTFLLEETARRAPKFECLCPPIIDFYDTAMHSHQRLEATIADYMDPSREAFAEYWSQREGDPQAELWEVFRAGYEAALGDRRAVLRFDTTERLEYERDSQEVLDDCEVTELDAPSWEWLLKRIGDLPRTAILIASRPTETLKRRLLEAHRGHVSVLQVNEFTLEETIAYLRETEIGAELVEDSPEVAERLHQLSEGRPILIALMLDWLKRGDWDRRKLFNISRDDFEMVLVGAIRDLKAPLDRAVKYAALARKGCNAELLQRLMGAGSHEVDRGEAEGWVTQLLELSFVKPPRPGGRGMFFLHDEMYDLVEKHVWLSDWPDYQEQARLDEVIGEWYTEQIEALSRRIREAGINWRERDRLRREQQLLMAERLYYQFDADPRLGYREYSRLDEEAIAQREMEWDTWLRNEALWFTSHRAWRRGDQNNQAPDYPKQDPAKKENGTITRSPAVEHDCRRRWVNRYIARNQMMKAAGVARKLLDARPLEHEPELYRPGLQIALATAQAYLGGEHIETAIANFDSGFSSLEKVPHEHREPWLYPYLLGSGYLYKGLALRGKLWLDQAIEAYSQAARCFREIDYRPGLAEATNNLAYALARQGRLHPALSACDKALQIRRGLGDEYGIGLSLNTKGIINERLGRPITAIDNSERALNIFREIGNTRGVILAQINLGRSYRRKARSLEWGQDDGDFEKGEGYLKEALRASSDDTDRFYRVEVFSELGCLYRDWVATLHEKGERNGRIPEFLAEAEKYLQGAVELTAEQEQGEIPYVVQHVDALEDLARVHYWRGRLELPCDEGKPYVIMDKQLASAEALAEGYIKDRREFNLILGKVFFQRARVAQLEPSSDIEKVGRYYGLAVGYSEAFSFDAPEAHKFADDANSWLSGLEPADAKCAVMAMHDALCERKLESKRLREYVENVINPLLGVGWPRDEEETNG